MKRISNLFMHAKTCTPETRCVGLEVETLFMRESQPGYRPTNPTPIGMEESQAMMDRLFCIHGWKYGKSSNTVRYLQLEKNGFIYLYELGWNNFELITPAVPVSKVGWLLVDTTANLNLLGPTDVTTSAGSRRITPIQHCYDGFEDEDTLMMPDKRDRIWLDLDGPVLKVLGHIASVHVNVDLTSVDEGMRFIHKMNALARRMNWPHPDQVRIWERYIRGSLAVYEPNRYGFPPEHWEEYCVRLGRMKVRMNREDGELYRVENPDAFAETPDVDMDLFLRSVWWHSRLRVRGDKLVLEIRVIPRGSNDDLERDVKLVLCELDIIQHIVTEDGMEH